VSRLSGRVAVGIVLEEISEVIGRQRAREIDRKIRARLPQGGSGQDWIAAIAAVITEDDDTRAGIGFRKGIRRIRSAATLDNFYMPGGPRS
jgi:hypothetical protein